MLLPETATPLAFYDHPFFGKYPALTRNAFGKGTVTYQASVLTDALQEKVVADVLKQAGIAPEAGLPAKVRARQAVGARRQDAALLPELLRRAAVLRLRARRRDRAPLAEAGGGGGAAHPRAVGPRGGPGMTAGSRPRERGPPRRHDRGGGGPRPLAGGGSGPGPGLGAGARRRPRDRRRPLRGHRLRPLRRARRGAHPRVRARAGPRLLRLLDRPPGGTGLPRLPAPARPAPQPPGRVRGGARRARRPSSSTSPGASRRRCSSAS